MWASAPTNDRRKSPDFEGRTGSSAPTTGIGKSCVGRKIAAFPISRRGGPMWASAPTNDHGKAPDFEGRTESSAPTTGIGKSCVGRKIAAFSVSPTPKNGNTPRGGGRTLLHWVSFSRRRGRCPHRPAGDGRFMVLFRRIHVDFPFCTVGADDPVRPPGMPVFTEIRCEFATF